MGKMIVRRTAGVASTTETCTSECPFPALLEFFGVGTYFDTKLSRNHMIPSSHTSHKRASRPRIVQHWQIVGNLYIKTESPPCPNAGQETLRPAEKREHRL
jgi:hypothetical protein